MAALSESLQTSSSSFYSFSSFSFYSFYFVEWIAGVKVLKTGMTVWSRTAVRVTTALIGLRWLSQSEAELRNWKCPPAGRRRVAPSSRLRPPWRAVLSSVREGDICIFTLLLPSLMKHNRRGKAPLLLELHFLHFKCESTFKKKKSVLNGL